MFESFIKNVLKWILETLLYWKESFFRMIGAKASDKYGEKDNKSNQQVALIRVLFILLVICFIVIIFRLSYIVSFKGEEYKRMVYSQRQASDIVIPCERGSIYDAKGTVLASNVKKYIIILDSKQVMDYSKQMGNSKYIEATADALNKYLGFDKQEIITISEKIGTFETSILPYEDCCTIFVAKHPVTKPKLSVIKKSEGRLSDCIDALVEKALETDEVINVI